MTRVLFAASEAYPLIKTGGLGDVAGSLPPALRALHCDVRLILPAYREALDRCKTVKPVMELAIPEAMTRVTVLETLLPGTRLKTWLVQHDPSFDRPGNPYHDGHGHPWPDNAQRFALFSRVVAALATGRSGLAWQADILHCHDWQTGLAPALLSLEPQRPATVFTIHNLAYQGLFPQHVLYDLGLPPQWWSPAALEFYGQLSFIKGGLVFADHLTTVSPTYAAEIQTPAFGHGLEGLLHHRRDHLSGLLNGIDDRTWNPAHDPHLTQPYSRQRPEDKAPNKQALQRACGLTEAARTPLIGLISRLVDQKGIDLVVEALPRLLQTGTQMVVLGNGQPGYQQALQRLARRHPGQLHVHIGYDEAFAHQIEGGADMFLMPSRFEPCGLNQLYSLRYGTVPIVRGIGGLADTVVDASPINLRHGKATGIVFGEATADALIGAVQRALSLYHHDPDTWQGLIRQGMRRAWSWRDSAQHYLALYNTLLPPGAGRI